MERWMGQILFIAVFLISVTVVSAQDQSDATTRLQNLREHLAEIQYKETDLKIQLEQLQFELQPENIERHFSGVGSTRPEELRELRRRELETRKHLVTTELAQLAAGRSNLEAAISNAEIHRQSAMGMVALQRDRKRTGHWATLPLFVAVGLVLSVILGSLLLREAIRKRGNR